jgi:hypothetical protein
LASHSPESLRTLREDYRRYDEYVDIVSCFEWLFTGDDVQDLPDTVAYFERFPRCVIGADRTLTPDFIVVFNDDSVLVGEIATIANHDNSVDKLCSQLLAYEEIDRVDLPDGTSIVPSRMDVMWLAPVEISNPACRRVLVERMNSAQHSYSPVKAPCIVQYARLADKYTFARVPHSDNGQLASGLAICQLQSYLVNTLNIKPARFVDVKTEYAFMNDRPSVLYLATYLQVRFWPMLFGAGTSVERVSIRRIATSMQTTYNYGRVKEIRRALELLQDAGLASPKDDDEWEVRRKIPGRGGKEAHEKILELIENSTLRRSINPQRRRSIQTENQLSLF